MRLVYVLLTALAVVPAQAAQTRATGSSSTQVASPSARVAAVHFAIAQGWKFPKTNIIVAEETDLGVMHGRSIGRSPAEQKRYSEEIARIIGPEVKVARAVGKFLEGRGATGPPYYSKTDVSVLEVSEVLEGGTDLRLAVYSRGPGPTDPPTVTSAVIDLERREKNWIGVRYSMGPKTLTGKR